MWQRYETWTQRFDLPARGQKRVTLVCPKCHQPFQLKIHSMYRTRLRKLRFGLSFFVLASIGVGLDALAGGKAGLLGFGLAAPFALLAAWHLTDLVRGRFHPSDVVTHGAGKVHRIFDDHIVTFSPC